MTVAGLVLGAVLGTALARVLVSVLTGVFDPPPSALAVPWAFLAGLALAIVACAVAASLVALSQARRAPVAALRET